MSLDAHGGRPDILGQTLDLDDWFSAGPLRTRIAKRLQIVGVAHSGFAGVEPGFKTDAWIPNMMFNPDAFTRASWEWFRVLGRPKSGVTPEQAQYLPQKTLFEYRRDHPRDFRKQINVAIRSQRPFADTQDLRAATMDPGDYRGLGAPYRWIERGQSPGRAFRGKAAGDGFANLDWSGVPPSPAFGRPDSFEWNSPPFETRADFEKTPVTRRFGSLKEFSRPPDRRSTAFWWITICSGKSRRRTRRSPNGFTNLQIMTLR